VVVRLLGELGGELHVKSEPRRGSTFEARLPTEPPAAPSPVARAAAADDAPTPAEVYPGLAASGVETEPPRTSPPVAAERAGVELVGSEPFDVLCRRIVHLHEAEREAKDARLSS
jgi:hypothetical protein